MACCSLGPDSDLTVSDLFPIQQSPAYRDYQLISFQTQNIHESALAVGGSGRTLEAPPSAGPPEPRPGADHGMLQHHVEMLVVILKDDVAWRQLQRSTRSCSSMRIRHELDAVLKRNFQVAVERGERRKKGQFLHELVIESYGIEEQSDGQLMSLDMDDDDDDNDGAHTRVAKEISRCGEDDDDDDDNDDDDNLIPLDHCSTHCEEVEEEDGEFLMGGRRGQGMLLEPISYKDIDLMRHPMSQILGGSSPSVIDMRPNRHREPKETAVPAVLAPPPRRRSSLSRPCPPARPPRVERV